MRPFGVKRSLASSFLQAKHQRSLWAGIVGRSAERLSQMFDDLLLGRGLEPRLARRGGDQENGKLAGRSGLSKDAGAKPRIAQK